MADRFPPVDPSTCEHPQWAITHLRIVFFEEAESQMIVETRCGLCNDKVVRDYPIEEKETDDEPS